MSSGAHYERQIRTYFSKHFIDFPKAQREPMISEIVDRFDDLPLESQRQAYGALIDRFDECVTRKRDPSMNDIYTHLESIRGEFGQARAIPARSSGRKAYTTKRVVPDDIETANLDPAEMERRTAAMNEAAEEARKERAKRKGLVG